MRPLDINMWNEEEDRKKYKPRRHQPSTENSKSLKCFLERDLLAYKAFSFFIYGGFGALYPYLPLYFKSYGLSSFKAGIIVGIRPLIQFFGAPLWTDVAERFRASRLILCGGILAWIVKALLLWAIDPKNQLCIETYINSTTNVSSIYTRELWKSKYDLTKVKWIGVLLTKHPNGDVHPKGNDFVTHSKINSNTQIVKLKEKAGKKHVVHVEGINPGEIIKEINKIVYHTGVTVTSIVKKRDLQLNETITFYTQIDDQEIDYLFLIFMMIIIIGEFLESPTYALSDASLLNRLGDDRNYYGQIRLWGAIGWALSTACSGAVLYTTRSLICAVLRFDYNVVFYVYFGFVSCAFICVYWFSFQKTEDEQNPSLRKAFTVLCKPVHVTFLVTILFSGCCFGFLFHFVNWYIDDKGGSTLVMGAAGAARELGEMTFFFLGGSCVRFLGHMNSMAICLLCYAACFYWFSIISVPWMAVPLEALDGAIYGLVWCNCVSYMSTLGAPIGAVVIMQGILQGVFYGLGNGGGTVLSGHLYELLGPQTTFHYFAISSLVVLLFLLIAFPIFDKNNTEDDYVPIATERVEVNLKAKKKDAGEKKNQKKFKDPTEDHEDLPRKKDGQRKDDEDIE